MIRLKNGIGRLCYKNKDDKKEAFMTRWAGPGDVITLTDSEEASLIARGIAEKVGKNKTSKNKAVSNDDTPDEDIPSFEAEEPVSTK